MSDPTAPIRERSDAVPPGIYRWEGNTDQPDTIRLTAPSYIGPDGKEHWSRSVLALIAAELTERDAHLLHVGDPDFFDYPEYEHPEFFQPPLTPEQQLKVAAGQAVAFREREEGEDPEEYDDAFDDALAAHDDGYDAAYDAHMQKHLDEHIREWLRDEYGEPRRENRLAFGSADDIMLREARELAIYQVAPQVTDLYRDNSDDPAVRGTIDPKVYRRDIIGLRSPVAVFLAHAKNDIDTLLAEVDRLRAENETLRIMRDHPGAPVDVATTAIARALCSQEEQAEAEEGDKWWGLPTDDVAALAATAAVEALTANGALRPTAGASR